MYYTLLKKFNRGGVDVSMKSISKDLIHPLISMGQGQNYWLNGCMAFLMECVGENTEYDYWFFSGITGDSFLQVYSKKPENVALCYSHIMTESAVKKAFDACGYDYEYCKDTTGKRPELDQRIREYIDKNVPVIACLDDTFHSFAIICGYDTTNFYFIMGEETTPKPYRYEQLIFIKDKKESPALSEAYKNAVMAIPALLNMPETKQFSFGKKAFMDWAYSFQSNIFERYPLDDKIWYTHGAPGFSCWNMHGTYLCMLGTNACAAGFLQKALALNPELTFIERLIPIYNMQCGKGFATLIEMEGGFGLKPDVIQDKERMKPICDEIIAVGNYCDNILEVFRSI